MEETYQGWTNYLTWRIYLEVFQDLEGKEDSPRTASDCKNHILCWMDMEEGFTFAYLAVYALDRINWNEIAESLNEYTATFNEDSDE